MLRALVLSALWLARTRADAADNDPRPLVTCAFKWEQSASEVHLFVKYAHKLDAPAVNDAGAPAVTVLPGSLLVEAESKSKRLRLELDLARAVDPARSSHERGTFGVTIVLVKASRASWPRLLAPPPGGKKAGRVHAHRWWEMEEKFDAEARATHPLLSNVSAGLNTNHARLSPTADAHIITDRVERV